MTQRLSLPDVAPEAYRAFVGVDRVLREAPLDPRLKDLVKLRASQLNGCVFCVDMHAHDALELGETHDRLLQLTVWRESELFTDAERAALAYAEAATRLGEQGVPDEVWDEVTAHFKAEEQGTLVALLALINAWNRIAVPMRTRPPARPVPAPAAS